MRNSCYICGNGNVELHHIIKRSQCTYMKDAEINLISLCPFHHRGDEGVHGKDGHKLDLQLKEELQLQLLLLFNNEFYTQEEIQELLKINKNSTRKLVKTLTLHDNKYKSYDVVKRCLGDRWYGDR